LTLDDLLGLIFVLVFIVGPILKGLFQRDEVLELPEEAFPAEETPPPPPEPPKAKERVPVRPVAVAPKPAEPEPSPPPAEPRHKRRKKLKLGVGGDAIVEGIVWHEILSEPRAKRRWQPKR